MIGQEEDSHRRRMRDVDDLLADLRGERVTDAEPVTPVHAVVASLEAAEAEAPSLLDVLDERIAAMRAGTAGLAA